MKIQLIDSRPGAVTAVVLKEWMRIGLSICLLGLPVILGYFSIQLTEARNAEFAKDSTTPALGDAFELTPQTSELQRVSGTNANTVASHRYRPNLQTHNYQGRSTGKTEVASFAGSDNAFERKHLYTLASAVEYASAFLRSVVLHKNGRVIDPAAYIHSTIR